MANQMLKEPQNIDPKAKMLWMININFEKPQIINPMLDQMQIINIMMEETQINDLETLNVDN